MCGVSGLGGASLATVLGKATTPPQEAILVTPTWVTPTEVCCHGNIVKWTRHVTYRSVPIGGQRSPVAQMRWPVYVRYVTPERSGYSIGHIKYTVFGPVQTPTLQAVMTVFPSSLTLHSPAYQMVVRRLVRERQFWAHAALMELVKCGAVTGK